MISLKQCMMKYQADLVFEERKVHNMTAKLIKIDRNGSKHYEGYTTCDRCGGKGYYAIAMHNGNPVLSPHDGGVCWKCGGSGKMFGKWIERTPEYQAKLDARRKAKAEALQAQWDAANAEREKQRKAAEEAERLAKEAEEARIKAQKAISQHVGQIGDKLNLTATFDHTAWFECKSFSGYGTETMYIHTFKDSDGNVLIWKTSNGLGEIGLQKGDQVQITGKVKEHNEYKDEKQTVLTRCKVVAK